MPRNISFSLTAPQFLDGSKDVTRRVGWKNLKAGDELWAVEKAMGLKKGEKIKRLGKIKVKSVFCERLDAMIAIKSYGRSECKREGFPNMNASEFVDFFCKSHPGCIPNSVVTRIEFERIKSQEGKSHE